MASAGKVRGTTELALTRERQEKRSVCIGRFQTGKVLDPSCVGQVKSDPDALFG